MKIRLDINNKAHLQRIKYVVGDYVMSNLAWFTYNIVRYFMGNVAGYGNLGTYLSSNMVVLGQIFFPLLMMVTYVFSGYYNNVCRKSRVQELLTTIASSGINTLMLFFLALINDVIGLRGHDLGRCGICQETRQHAQVYRPRDQGICQHPRRESRQGQSAAPLRVGRTQGGM